MTGVILFGLGNPGPKYKLSRHNFGFMVLDAFAVSGWSKRKNYYYQRRDNYFLAKPRLFMNNSGPALASLLAYLRIKKKDIAENILVILDDYQIPFGQARLRSGGGDGGHNGLRSVIETLATENFWRLRLGIGPLPAGINPADFVLQNFSELEQKNLSKILEKITDWLNRLRDYSIKEAASRWTNILL